MSITPTPRPPNLTDEDRAKLGEFLASAPLYAAIKVPGTRHPQDGIESTLPAEIQRECESDKCKGFASSWMLICCRGWI